MDFLRHMWIALTNDMKPVVKYTLGVLIYISGFILIPLIIIFITVLATIEIFLFQIGNSLKQLVHKKKEG